MFSSFKNRLILCFIFIVIIPISLVAFFSFYRQNKLIITDTSITLGQSVEQMNKLLEERLVEIDKRTWPLLSNDSLKIFNESFENMSYDYYKRFYSFKKDILLELVGDRTDVQSVNFISGNGKVFSSRTMFIKAQDINRETEAYIYKKLDEKPLKMVWVGAESPYILHEDISDENVSQKDNTLQSCANIMAVRKVISAKTGEEQGIIIINFKSNFLSKILGESFAGIKADLVILDDENRYLLTNAPQKLNRKAEPELVKLISRSSSGHEVISLAGKKYLCVFNSSLNSGWKIAALITEEELLQKNRDQLSYIFFLIIAGGIAFIGISIAAAFWIASPITELTTVMETAADGNLGVRVKINAVDEIQKLAGSFNKMMMRIQNLVEKNREIEKEKNLAEVKALQMQINPHFLYNTLNSIYLLSKKYDVKPIMEMTYSLSNMFRNLFSLSGGMVTVRESIQQLESYITIQKIRFKDKFDVVYDIEDEVYDCKVPNLLIQPIIENSIIHGIEKKKGNGQINVIGYKMNGIIKIVVEDNGVGVSPERLEEIKRVLENNQTDDEVGMIALRNVNRRLKLNFGEGYGLNVFSEEGKGMTVELVFPEVK